MSKATGTDQANSRVIQREMSEQPVIWVSDRHRRAVATHTARHAYGPGFTPYCDLRFAARLRTRSLWRQEMELVEASPV